MFYSPFTLIAVPVIAGLVCLALPDRAKTFIRIAALSVSLTVLAGTIFIFLHKPLVWKMGSRAVLLADNLAAFIALAVAVFALLVIIYSFGFTQNAFGRYFGYTLMTLGASIGAVFANDAIELLIFWGFLALMLYMMTNLKGTNAAARASKKALIIIGGTDALMLFGICLIWPLSKTFVISDIHLQLSSPLAYAAYFSLAIAAFAKAGAVPFHSWLPDVAESAPTNVAAYLPASLDKLLGIYLLARISLDIFSMNTFTNFILALIGSVTIVFAVAMALTQHNMKRLLGYHAVSQVGYMVLGIGTGSIIGIAGALFHMLNNVIYKSCLFFTAGAVERKAGTVDMAKLGGLVKYMPVTFAACLVASLSISGIPPFNGFVSKWMIYQGIIESAAGKNPSWIIWLVCAMFGSALTIASFMKLLHSVFLGRPDKAMKGVKEAGLFMTLPMVILAAVCIVFGIFAAGLPIAIFIGPSLGGAISYIGTWNPIMATVLILAALALGALSYRMMRPAKFRSAGIFIGGEDVNELYRVTGTEFYNTVMEVPALKGMYKKEEAGALDIYDIARKCVYSLAGYLQRLHNGILPTYMIWSLLGMVGIFAVIFLRQ
jgi:formate hydrogenlyase subunit 3/multisubunit Na+/H+ antiporter MnhD subunit